MNSLKLIIQTILWWLNPHRHTGGRLPRYLLYLEKDTQLLNWFNTQGYSPTKTLMKNAIWEENNRSEWVSSCDPFLDWLSRNGRRFADCREWDTLQWLRVWPGDGSTLAQIDLSNPQSANNHPLIDLLVLSQGFSPCHCLDLYNRILLWLIDLEQIKTISSLNLI